MIVPDPFDSSERVARWAAEVLSRAGISELKQWRMVEYWMQVELYRAVQAGRCGSWRHLGDYEQPYWTAKGRSGSKLNVKWADLVLGAPESTRPEYVVWIELKDIGRNPARLAANASGLGQDSAALLALDPAKTVNLLRDPPEQVKDGGRVAEWNGLANALSRAQHLACQIVVAPAEMAKGASGAEIEKQWRESSARRATVPGDRILGTPAVQSLGSFLLFALVLPAVGGR